MATQPNNLHIIMTEKPSLNFLLAKPNGNKKLKEIHQTSSVIKPFLNVSEGKTCKGHALFVVVANNILS